jgi:hypothetical protein
MTEASSDERVLGIVGGTGPESKVDPLPVADRDLATRHREGDQVPI